MLIERKPRLTPEQARTMPGAFIAYRRVDGQPLYEDFVWLCDEYDCGGWDGDDVDEIEEVVMVPVRVRVFPCHPNSTEEA